MNRKAKGQRTVAKAIEYLEKQEYIVDKVEKTGRFQKGKDLFGLFDLVAIHPERNTVFVQVKTNPSSLELKKYKDFTQLYPYTRAWLMIWESRKIKGKKWGMKIYKFSLGTLTHKEDLRTLEWRG